jgi:tetratricopeptide (TPR) repeat protein
MSQTSRRLYRPLLLLLLVGSSLFTSVLAQDIEIMSTEEVYRKALQYINARKFAEARPFLTRLITDLEDIKEDNIGAKQTVEWCYFNLGVISLETAQYDDAISDFQKYKTMYPKGTWLKAVVIFIGEIHAIQANWQEVINSMLPVTKDRTFTDDHKLLAYQLLAEAYYRLEKWKEAINPNLYIFNKSRILVVKTDAATKATTCYVRLDMFEELFAFLPKVLATSAKYDVDLNLALLEAGDRHYEKDAPNRALMMYRLVYNKTELIDYMEQRLLKRKGDLAKAGKSGGLNTRATTRKNRIKREMTDIEAALARVKEYPDYDQELVNRMAQTYLELDMYWEAIVLFRSIFDNFPSHELAEVSLYQAFTTALGMNNRPKVYKEAFDYMDAYPNGEYWDHVTLTMAEYRLDEEKYEKVVEIVDRAITVDPEHKYMDIMLFHKAFSNFQLDNVELALKEFGVIIEEHPDTQLLEPSKYWHAMAHLFLGHFADSRAEFASFIIEFTTYSAFTEDASFRLAGSMYGQSEFEASEKQLVEFVKKYPDSNLMAEVLAMLGDIYASWSLLDKAIDCFARVPNHAPNMVLINNAVFQSGKILELEQRYDQIIKLFTDYKAEYQTYANHTEATYWIGNALRQKGDLDGALKTYFQAIVDHGNDPKAYGIDMILKDLISERKQYQEHKKHGDFMARLYAELENSRKANKVTLDLRLRALFARLAKSEENRRALKISLLNKEYLKVAGPITLVLMGEAAMETRDPDYALVIYEHFLTEHSDSDLTLAALKGVAEARILNTEYKEAEEILLDIITRFPMFEDAAWAQKRTADIYRMQKKYSEAERAYQNVLSVREWSGAMWPAALYGIGEVYHEQKKYEEASAYYQRIFVLYESYPEWVVKGYIRFGDCMMRTGHKDEAIKALKELTDDSDPNDPTKKDPIKTENIKFYQVIPEFSTALEMIQQIQAGTYK